MFAVLMPWIVGHVSTISHIYMPWGTGHVLMTWATLGHIYMSW
jgi:hypothetical protein